MIRKYVRLLGVVAIGAASGACSDTVGERPADAPRSPDDHAAPDAAVPTPDAPPGPVADASMGLSVFLDDVTTGTNIETALDGRHTSDPLNRTRRYDWTVRSAPPGSVAIVRDADLPLAFFTPDREGAYVIALTVSADSDSATATMTLTATNLPPAFDLAPLEVTYTGAPIDVTAEATDPNGDPIVSYRWRVKGHPEGSSATVSSSSATVRLVPDLDGPYVLEVIASDGRADSTPFDVSVTSYHPLAPLVHRIIAAEMSKSLSRIVMVDDGPASLYIYDPVAKSEVAVPLSATPTSVSVSPDGHFAAVGHDGSFSYVDLVNAEVVKVYTLTVPVLNLVLAGNGYVYVFPSSFPASNPFPAMHIVDLQTGFESETGVSSFFFAYATVGRVHPDGARIYAADNGVNPSIVVDYDIASPANPTSSTGPPMGDYFFCDDIWLTEDGARVITRCGKILRATTSADTDMTDAGVLAGFSGLEHIQDVSDSKAAGKLVVVGAAEMFDNPDGDEVVFIYGDQDFDLEERLSLGAFIVNGTAYPARGRFVFADPDGANYHVFVEADPSAGLVADYAVATYAFGSSGSREP